MNRFSTILGISYLLLVICLSSCGQQCLNSKSYAAWFTKENGVVIDREIDGVVFKASYVTPELMQVVRRKEVIIHSKDVEESLNFILSIRPKNVNQNFLRKNSISEEEYRIKLNYLSFNIKDDIKLIIDGHTIAPSLCINNEMGDVNQGIVWNLSFDYKWDRNKDLILEYDDKLFDDGKIKFEFTKENIEKIPCLELYAYDNKNT